MRKLKWKPVLDKPLNTMTTENLKALLKNNQEYLDMVLPQWPAEKWERQCHKLQPLIDEVEARCLSPARIVTEDDIPY